MPNINARTRDHYNSLLTELSDDYVDYRWKSHPLQRLHYLQTRLTLRGFLKTHVGHVDRMLEIGCGPGTWTDTLLSHADELTLLDISREMLCEAKKKYDNEKRVSLVCGDFNSGVISRHDTFDAVVSIRALEYMSSKEDAVRIASRLLKPEGVLLVITKNPQWRDAKGESGLYDDESEGIHSDWVSLKSLSEMVRRQGLNVLAVRPAAMGSYEFPLSNTVGRFSCHVLHRLLVNFSIYQPSARLVESYALAARNQGEAGNA